jgi:hypothetical protein
MKADFATAAAPARRARRTAWLVIACVPVALLAQQRDVVKTPELVAGGGEISGVVVNAEGGQPLRQVIVTMTGGGTTRSVLTDDAGRFTLARVPEGTFTVTARKAAYLDAPFGARRPGRLGVPIALAKGQRVQLTIPMFRGAAITGGLRDAAGQPIGGVDVRIIDVRTFGVLERASPPQLARSDDRGVFRIYGVLPGDYFVVALPTATGELVAPTASSIDAALAALAARSSGAAARPPAPPPPPAPPSAGYAPVYFPGTTDHRDAVRVTVAAGEERAGIDFDLRSIPMGSIEGVVSGPVPNLAAVQVTLISTGPRVTTTMSSVSLAGRPIDAQGLFRYANLPPGSYRLVARARVGDVAATAAPPSGRGGGAGAGGGGIGPPGGAVTPTTDYIYGVADVELRGQDVTGVALTLLPGGSISGRIAFAGSSAPPPPEQMAKMRATLQLEGSTGSVSTRGLMMGTGLVSSPISVVNPDGTFHIRGIGPGRFGFVAAFPFGASAGPWKLRSVTAGGRDLLDFPIDVGPGMHLRDVVITFSDARTGISGTLQTGSGVPTIEYDIVALPADRALWTPRSRRVLSVRPGTDGRFVFADPPAGEYLIAALRDLDPIDLWDPAFLEQIAPSAVKVTVREGETKVQDLRIR